MRRGLLLPQLPLLLLLLAALLGGCFGGATETETGTAQITGEVKWPDGRPAVGAHVRLRPSDFQAAGAPDPAVDTPFVRDTVTDAAGRYAFNQVPVGTYQVEALHSEGYGALAEFEVAEDSGRVKVGGLTLQASLSVTGRVRFSDSTLGPASVHVLGTEHWAQADSATGSFTLREMPPGMFDLRVSTPVPFFPAKDFPGQEVEGTASVDLGDLVLDKGAKQTYSLAGGKVTLEGIDGSNPVIYDNDYGANTWDNEFLWALASRGKVDLRGHIATLVPRDSQDVMPVEFAKLIREARICRQSGMRNIPEPILGASRKLALPPGGRWQDIQPESNPGIRLLVEAARSASVEKPLVVVAGGSLSTVANAVLLDPSIVDKMVVFGAYNNDLNAKDSLASYLVARKCRFVEWGRDYFWAGPGPSAAALPQNWMGRQLTAFRDSTFFPPLFFADFAALPFLVDGRSWKSARVARVLSPPLNVSLEASGPFDFIDIPQDANDWALMDQVFFSVLADSGAYHPWPVPGQVEGVSFQALSGAAVDSVAGEGEAVTGIGAGDWMEYALEVAAEGDYDVTLRYRCSEQAAVRLTGGAAASLAELDLPAGTAWVETRARIRLGKGTQSLRFSTTGGSWQLGRIQLERAP